MRTVYLNAGHGGKDPGNCARGCREADIALDITLRVARYLRLLSKPGDINSTPSIKTVLSRTGNEYLDVDDVAFRARQSNADLFVSFHTDSSIKPTAKGSTVYYHPSTVGPQGASIDLGNDILQVAKGIGLTSRGVRADNISNHKSLGVLRNTCQHMQSILIEMWFQSNAGDNKLMSTKEVREQYALHVATSIILHFRMRPRWDLIK